jgi:hypothetical protein
LPAASTVSAAVNLSITQQSENRHHSTFLGQDHLDGDSILSPNAVDRVSAGM